MEIKPFKAFRFDVNVVDDAGSCISPPYDVINSAQQQKLYEKSEYNIVRIIRGKTTTSDDDANNQYTRAAVYLNDWLKQGVLKQDSDESIYSYVQDFEIAGRQFSRSSFIALAKLEGLGGAVKPHEKTMDGPKADRLRLQLACNAKFGLIFVLYKDRDKIADKISEKAMQQQALVDFVDEQNVRHRLFAVTSKNDTDAITKMMADRSCMIADGHHRYETALNYYKQTGNPNAAYQMMAFANTCNEGLVILATHRLVDNVKDFSLEKLLAGLKKNFEISEYKFDSPQNKTQARQKMLSQMKADFDKDKNSFGIYGKDNTFYVAVLRDSNAMDPVAPDMSRPWQSLNVAVLHKLVLEELLGIGDKQLADKTNLEYVKDTSSAIDDSIAKVDTGQKQVAFFTNPEKIDQVLTVAGQGETMPQKSTYFYPKVHTGLTINKL